MKKFDRNKKMFLVNILYGIIVVLANICGIIIPNLFNSTSVIFYDNSEWFRFLEDYRYFTDTLQYFSFIIPTILCYCYVEFSDKNYDRRFINLPVAFSAIGITGWVFYLIMELLCFIFAFFKGYEINYWPIFLSSFMNVLMNSIITFSLSYFVMERIHRRFFLPYFYPEGRLSANYGVKGPSMYFLFISNYLSVTLFPILFLLTIYTSIVSPENRDVGIYYVLFAILGIGWIITFSMLSFFETPVDKIMERIKKIKGGDYKSHISIISNDIFGELADVMNEMTDSIDRNTRRIVEMQNSVITGMATMVESRDNSTGGHIKRTSDSMRIFLDYLMMNDLLDDVDSHFYEHLIKAAPMHDLGKIAVNDAILRKPGRFTDEEYEMMKKHSAEGARIVGEVLSKTDDAEFRRIAVNVAHYHHEKWDGKGYPEGLSGESIPVEARIMALVDVFDALVSRRCYKDSFSYDKAFDIIQESLGTHFDPVLGREFIKCRPALETLYNSYVE